MLGDLEAGAVGHLQVEERDVRPELVGLRDSLLAAVRQADLVTFAAQENAEHQHGVAVVVRDQHANAVMVFLVWDRLGLRVAYRSRIVPRRARAPRKSLLRAQ